MNEIFKAINSGIIKRTRKPNLIKIVKLEDFIKHSTNINKVCRSIVYSMVREIKDRDNEEWIIIYNYYRERINNEQKYWKDIAVYSKGNVHTFNDIICIDFKVIREDPEFFIRYPQIKTIILSELRQV